MNYLELIESRNSIRDFYKKKVEQSKTDELISFFNSVPKLFEVNAQILIANDDEVLPDIVEMPLMLRLILLFYLKRKIIIL